MAVHVFPIESVPSSLLGGDSIANMYTMVRTYLGQRGQSGDTVDKYLSCASRGEVEAAVDEFLRWSQMRPHGDPKVLWLSLHGQKPSTPAQVGTLALSAGHSDSSLSEHEIVEWAPVFAKLRARFPPGVIVLSDVCWGASPTAPARLTNKNGNNPAMFFGSVRRSHRLELDAAAAIVFGVLARHDADTR